jgi:hypothetical protein
MPWKLEDWEEIVEKIVDDSNHASKQSGKRKVLTNWRSQLEEESTGLQAFQIDMIVREVQRRLKANHK